MRKLVAVIAVVGATLLGTALPSSADSSKSGGLFEVSTCNGTRGTRDGSFSATRSGTIVTVVFKGHLNPLDEYALGIDKPVSSTSCQSIVSSGQTYTAQNDGFFRKRIRFHVPRSERQLIFSVSDRTNPSLQLNSNVVGMRP